MILVVNIGGRVAGWMLLVTACGPGARDPASIELAFIRSDEDRASWVVGTGLGDFALDLIPREQGVRIGSVGWSPDGEHLVATRSRDGEHEVVIVEIASGITTVLPGLLGAIVSPRAPVFLSRRMEANGEASWVQVEIDGGEEAPVGDLGPVLSLDWSPDGERWAVLAQGEGDVMPELRLVDVDSGEATEVSLMLADGTSIDPNDVAWSPSGDVIVGSTPDPEGQGDSRIFAVDLTEGRVELWQGEPFHGFEAPSWSPDGSRLAAPAWGFDAVQPRDYAVVVFSGTGAPSGRVATARELAWSSDGRWAAAMLADDGTLRNTHITVGEDEDEQWQSSAPGGEVIDSEPRWRPGLR